MEYTFNRLSLEEMTEKFTVQPCCFSGPLNLATSMETNITSDQSGPGVSGDRTSDHHHSDTETAPAGVGETPLERTRFLTDEDLSPPHIVHKSPAMFSIFSSNGEEDMASVQSDGESSNSLDDVEVILGPSTNQLSPDTDL